MTTYRLTGGAFAIVTGIVVALAVLAWSAAAAAIVLVTVSGIGFLVVLARAILPAPRRTAASSNEEDAASSDADVRVPLRSTVLKAARAWWQSRTTAQDRWAPAVTIRPVPSVGGPYVPLNKYLEHRFASNVVLSFEQIESLLGCALPAPARTDREWWT